MKYIHLIVFVLIISTTTSGQEFFIESGTTISSFDYHNSQGIKLDNLQASTHGFLSLGYRESIFTKNLFLNLGASYNNYGALGSDRALDNYFEWDVTYLGVNVGLDYELFHPGRFSFFIKTGPSLEFLVLGAQTLRNQVYDLVGEEDFDTPLLFIRGGLGTQYQISRQSSVYFQYMGGKGFNFSSSEEDLKIAAHSFGFGLLINISKELPKMEAVVPGDTAEIIEDLKNQLETNAGSLEELESVSKEVEDLKQQIKSKDESLEVLNDDLIKVNERVSDLENASMARTKELELLRENIAKSILAFDQDDLEYEIREGQIHVTMGSDLLFQQGNWALGEDGEQAIAALGNTIAQNPDWNITIVGHTDNRPYIARSGNNIENNWDLSAKRASSIIDLLLKNENIRPENLTVAGRGEYHPIAENDTPEGRADNRRIEIILTPDIEEVLKLIKE